MQQNMPQPWAPKWQRFLVAFFAAGFLFDVGHKVLDVQIELYWGIAGYDFTWVIAMFLLPFLTGIVVSLIYGWGGKLVAHFPPLAVLALSYYVTAVNGAPEGAQLIPLMWWGFFVILNMEFCAVGGVIGELLLRRFYRDWNDMPGTSGYGVVDSEALPREEDK